MQLGNNKATFCGQVASEPVYSHSVQDEKFYIFVLSVSRLSGTIDELPVMANEYLMSEEVKVGKFIIVEGSIRTHNDYSGDHMTTKTFVFARGIRVPEEEAPVNEVHLDGVLARTPVLRTTLRGVKIADLLLKVQRYNRYDYVRCIAWGSAAVFSATLNRGDGVALDGRLQSRSYVKKLSETEEELRMVYEVSAAKLKGTRQKEEAAQDSDEKEDNDAPKETMEPQEAFAPVEPEQYHPNYLNDTGAAE